MRRLGDYAHDMLPAWAEERGERKLQEETEKYRAMSPAQRFEMVGEDDERVTWLDAQL